jgi:hypothetical protein
LNGGFRDLDTAARAAGIGRDPDATEGVERVTASAHGQAEPPRKFTIAPEICSNYEFMFVARLHTHLHGDTRDT